MFRRFLPYCLIVVLGLGIFWFYKTSDEVQEVDLSGKQKICLNMIVKNESRVIKRCLASIKPLIDHWIIVDTGSDDGTQKIIKEYLKDIPGKLYERPWKNFEHNRNEALQLAQGKGDYILFMDADDVLEFEGEREFPLLTKDLYNMWRGWKGFTVTYAKPQLVRSDMPWKWVGVTHEYLGCDQFYYAETLPNVRYVTKDDGASSRDPKKFHKNIDLLEEGLKKEPNNDRYAFYLAESYRCAGEKGKALEWYQKRINMQGWNEEVFMSLLQIGHLLRDLGLPSSLAIDSYKRAHEFRPHRAEPLYYLAELYNKEKEYSKAYDCIKQREHISKPAQKDLLFNEDWIDEFGLLFQLSISSYYLGYHQESLDLCDQLLTIKDLPESTRRQTEINRAFPFEKLQIAKLESKTKGRAQRL